MEDSERTLNELISKCKAGVQLFINEHKNNYESVERYFMGNPYREETLEEIDEDIYKKMIELDTIIDLHYYPNTPVGFYNIYHYDLGLAIKEALETFDD